MTSRSISVYTSHDSSVCYEVKPGTYRVYELERLTSSRYCRIEVSTNPLVIFEQIREMVHRESGSAVFDRLYHCNTAEPLLSSLAQLFGTREVVAVGHHASHAACAFQQSPFGQALIFSFDGGGWDHGHASFFNVYTQRKGAPPTKIATLNVDFGNPYSVLAAPIREVKPGPDDNYNSLSYAGKIMGLCAYGTPRSDWMDPVRRLYSKMAPGAHELTVLGREIGIELGFNTIEDQLGYDLAATSQAVFEERAAAIMMPFIEHFKLPVVLTGGCALNVLFNQRLQSIINYPVYIPCNPNDCGLAFGQLVHQEPRDESIETMYNGCPILDIDQLPRYVRERGAVPCSPTTLASHLCQGKIIGVVLGDSEVGPRALGNRSILCDPKYPAMKDILNQKVKFREWFRPFAPVVREEHVDRYFHFNKPAQYMSYAPLVREAYREKVPSIVHQDSTARVQTVTQSSHGFLYSLIGAMEEIGGIGMVLNTSFNIKGKPILTSLHDAFEALDSTELDGVYIEGNLFLKDKASA